MKKLILALLSFALLPAQICRAQLVRVPIPFPSISSQYSPLIQANIAPNLPVIAVCHSPANQVPCTNYATTYTSSGAACLNGTQDTPDPQPSACQATGDAQGNLGFWVNPGTYDYTVCIQNTVTCLGPYTITVVGGAGSITFQTNSVNNGNQSKLNLKNGANVSIADDGLGGITVAASGGASFSTAGQAWFLGGQSYGPISDDNGQNISCASTANAVCAVQLTLASNWTISKIGEFTVTGTSSSGNIVTAAIYTADGNTKLIDAGANAFQVQNSQRYSQVSVTPVTLSAGTYLFAWGANVNSSGSVIAHVRMTWFGQMLNGISFGGSQTGTTHVGQATNTLSAGAMPATLGAITPITNSDPVNVPAIIFLP